MHQGLKCSNRSLNRGRKPTAQVSALSTPTPREASAYLTLLRPHGTPLAGGCCSRKATACPDAHRGRFAVAVPPRSGSRRARHRFALPARPSGEGEPLAPPPPRNGGREREPGGTRRHTARNEAPGQRLPSPPPPLGSAVRCQSPPPRPALPRGPAPPAAPPPRPLPPPFCQQPVGPETRARLRACPVRRRRAGGRERGVRQKGKTPRNSPGDRARRVT